MPTSARAAATTIEQTSRVMRTFIPAETADRFGLPGEDWPPTHATGESAHRIHVYER